MAEVTPELIDRLQQLSLVSAERCRAALQAHNGDIGKALRALAAAGDLPNKALAGFVMTRPDVCNLVTVRFLMIRLKDCDAQRRRKHWNVNDTKYEEMRAKLSAALGTLDPRPDFDPNAPLVMNPSPPVASQGGKSPVRQRPTPRSITVPPFPKLKPVAGDWEGNDTLTSWKGFQDASGAYTSRSSSRRSTGNVGIRVIPIQGESGDLPPSPEQVAAYRHLKDHESETTAAVLKAILRIYPKLRRDYGFGDSDYQDDLYMPRITGADDLRQLIGLGTVHVLDIAKAGHAYIGFECGCTWDEEHGLGILLHKQRIIEVGQADTAFDNWAAKKDGGKAIKPAKPS